MAVLPQVHLHPAIDLKQTLLVQCPLCQTPLPTPAGDVVLVSASSSSSKDGTTLELEFRIIHPHQCPEGTVIRRSP